MTERKINSKEELPFKTTHACAKAGTAVPEKKVSCPGDLTYFENGKKGQLGCKP